MSELAIFNTQGLEEGIRCAMCTNSMKSNRGCDGGCIVDTNLYKKVLDVLHQNLVSSKVPTAYWKVFSNGAYHGMDEDGEPIWREVNVYHCSHCNRRTVIKEKYCPSCGAFMNEKEQVNE